MAFYYMRENWSRDWWHKNLSAGTNTPSGLYLPENYLNNIKSAAFRHNRKWSTSKRDGINLGSINEPETLNKSLRQRPRAKPTSKSAKIREDKSLQMREPVDPKIRFYNEFQPDSDYNLNITATKLNALPFARYNSFSQNFKDKIMKGKFVRFVESVPQFFKKKLPGSLNIS